MDYSEVLGFHEQAGADITVCAIQVPMSEASRFGILSLDEAGSGQVCEFQEKPEQPKSNLASMGIYVFNTDVLCDLLERDQENLASSHDFGKDILPTMVAEGYRVFGHICHDYWVDVGTVQAYWEAHMDLLDEKAPLDLQDRTWVIHTRSEERPPVNLRAGASVAYSLISDGCVIEGAVEYSVLSPGVRVKAGSVVRNSIVMTDTVIDEMAVIDHAIIDKNVRIGARSHIGVGDDMTKPNHLDPRLDTGITLVGKNAVIPPGTLIGRNCIIGSDVEAEAFTGRVVPSGAALGAVV
jgi:glucose-1-phosphate adenylyltransferase